jgi:hypothetical protein
MMKDPENRVFFLLKGSNFPPDQQIWNTGAFRSSTEASEGENYLKSTNGIASAKENNLVGFLV